MKFGVAIVPHDLEETAVSARLAEEQGFDTLAFQTPSRCGGSCI